MDVLRMLRAGGLFGVQFDAPDAGAGGGSMVGDQGDAMPGADDASGVDSDAGDHAGGGEDADDEDSLLFGEDDDDQQHRRSVEEQLTALRKANRRLKSRYLKAKPIVDRLRGQDLDSIVADARSFGELRRAAQANPRLRALIYGGDADGADPTSPEAKPAALPSLPTQFTAEALGFDPDDSAANRVIANTIQTVVQLTRDVADLKALAPTVHTLNRTVQSSREQAEQREWSQALDQLTNALKQHVPGNKAILTFARDALVGAYNARHQHGKSPRVIVQAYLKDLVKGGAITQGQAGRINAATQARMATHNRTLPRSPAGGGTPAGPRGNERPRIKDVHRRLRAGEIGPRF